MTAGRAIGPGPRWPLALALLAGAGPALAQAAPTGPFALSGSATLTSDYRFRGLSQSGRRVAAQGALALDHASGAYAGAWASTIHGYVANGSDAELDLYAGYRRAFGGTTLDAGLLYYVYPGAGATDADYFEPYASAAHTLGPVTAKLGGNLAWRQHGLGLPDAAGRRDRRGGAYVFGELSAALPGTGFAVKGHAGRSLVRDYRTFGERYTDWSLTASYSWKVLTLSAAYVDTDRSIRDRPLGGGHDRDIAKGGVVGAVTLAF